MGKNRPTHKENVNKAFSYAFQGSMRKLFTGVRKAGILRECMHS